MDSETKKILLYNLFFQVKKYFSLINQLIFTDWISEMRLIHSNHFLAIWISHILLIQSIDFDWFRLREESEWLEISEL